MHPKVYDGVIPSRYDECIEALVILLKCQSLTNLRVQSLRVAGLLQVVVRRFHPWETNVRSRRGQPGYLRLATDFHHRLMLYHWRRLTQASALGLVADLWSGNLLFAERLEPDFTVTPAPTYSVNAQPHPRTCDLADACVIIRDLL